MPSPPLALGNMRLQLNPGAVSTIPISGGVAPYTVVFGPPVPVASSAPLATLAPLGSPAPPASAPATTGATSVTSAIATATIDEVRPALVVRAAGPVGGGVAPPAGTSSITVTDAAGASVSASLLVGPNAGFIRDTIAISLVGDPSPEFASAQIDQAIHRAANILPNARIAYTPPSVPLQFVPGSTIVLPVRVHLDGAGTYVDVDATPAISITTTVAPPVAPVSLFYSDDPENVKADGVLFRGEVTQRKPVRLYYYHQALAAGHQIAIVFDSPTGSSQVTVVGHGAGPNPAVMYVGQFATYRYLDDHARGSGVVLDLPVGAAVLVNAGDVALNRADLVAGALDIAVTSGDPARVTVLAYAPGTDPRALLDTPELPDDGFQRRGEYDLAQTTTIAMTERLAATTAAAASPDSETASPAAAPPSNVPPAPPPVPVPEPTFAVAPAGTALQNLRPGGRSLGGDYGVLHPVVLTLGNDGDAPGTLYLYEQPITGYPVTTTIAFDGDPAPLRLMCVKVRTHRYLVRAFAVAPHSTTTVTGSYMTDGGSTYPLVFGLTATPPLNVPPSMTDPDGCFPKAVPSPAPGT